MYCVPNFIVIVLPRTRLGTFDSFKRYPRAYTVRAHSIPNNGNIIASISSKFKRPDTVKFCAFTLQKKMNFERT